MITFFQYRYGKAAKVNLYCMLFILLSFIFLSCGSQSDTRKLKLAHGLNVDHPVHQGMLYMSDQLYDKSKGKLSLEIYPSQQLGSERQSLELLQIGSLAMTKVSAAIMENFAPKMQVLSLPYLFKGREHIYAFQDSQLGHDLLTESSKFWLRGLTYFDAGQRSFYSKTKPIHTPGDLKGQKIRVQESKTAMELVRSLGGAPTPISWGELYTALQQGIVDGAENNPPSFYTSRHYEVCKHYTLNEHTAVPDLLVISTHVWNSLTAQEQAWVQESANEAKDYQRKLWLEAEEKALAAVQKAGVEIIYPDKSQFAQITKEILLAYKDTPELYEIIKQIQNLNY